jgi:FKBP-type peptidyl-prolyl cis-trans isomerase (trigger factor)
MVRPVSGNWPPPRSFAATPMRLRSGIALLEEHEGDGEPAKKGDRVIYNIKIFLNRGDKVPLNERQAQYLPQKMIRTVDGCQYIDHETVLGSREAIAGVEYSLIGMKKDGYRKVRVSPHLAYRSEGLSDLIPPDAVLIVELWLREITR